MPNVHESNGNQNYCQEEKLFIPITKKPILQPPTILTQLKRRSQTPVIQKLILPE